MSGQRDSVSLHAMKKTLLLLLLLSLPLPLYATTVSGNLRDVGLSSLTQNVVIRFTLVNYGSNIPRVVGTNVIADDVLDFRPDSNGDISGTIQGNDTITPTSTFYRVCVILKGRRFRCFDFNITGSSFDLNSAAPITTAPTVTPPTGDTVYLRLDGGNQFTGNLVPNATGVDLCASAARCDAFLQDLDIVGTVTGLQDADIPNTITLDNLTQVTTRNHSSLQGIAATDHHATRQQIWRGGFYESAPATGLTNIPLPVADQCAAGISVERVTVVAITKGSGTIDLTEILYQAH